MPSTRKDLMFERRRREEAEGERRMMGSGRRPVGVLPRRPAEDVGTAGVGPEGRVEVRRSMVSAYLRTWEKSCCNGMLERGLS